MPAFSRRAAVTAAAWSVPAVGLAASAPAYASSQTRTADVVYLLDWAASGYRATTNPRAVARPVDATIGAPDLTVEVTPTWGPTRAYGFPMAQTKVPVSGDLEIGDREGTSFLRLAHQGTEYTTLGWRGIRLAFPVAVEVATWRLRDVSQSCGSNPWSVPRTVHEHRDALRFRPTTLTFADAAQRARFVSVMDPLVGPSGEPIFRYEDAAGGAYATDVDLATTSGAARSATLDLELYNYCKHGSDYTAWDNGGVQSLEIGPVTFVAEVELPTA